MVHYSIRKLISRAGSNASIKHNNASSLPHFMPCPQWEPSSGCLTFRALSDTEKLLICLELLLSGAEKS